MRIIAAIDSDDGPKQSEEVSPVVDAVRLQETLQTMARVILKLSRVHKSERISDQIAPADEKFLKAILSGI